METTTDTHHPRFAPNAKVTARGHRVTGTVVFSTPEKVIVSWDAGWVQEFDGWQAGNNLRPR